MTMNLFKRTLMLAWLAVAAAGVLIAAPAPSWAASTPLAGGTYTLTVAASGKCIDVPGAATSSGILLQQWGCTSGAAWQQFLLVSAGSGSGYNLINVNSRLCVDVPGSSTASGLQLQQWGCGNAQGNQTWRLTASGSGYEIVSKSSGLCLSDQGSSTASGAAIVQQACTGSSAQVWTFTAVSATGRPTVASDGTGQYTTVQAAIDAVPAGNASRVVITIKPGTYREIVTIPSTKPYITLVGLGSSASSTVIVDNHSSAAGFGTSGSATVFVDGHDVIADNLTISNDYGVGSQAVAANLNADRLIFDNVRFLGNQDTLLLDSGRSYIVNTYIEGTEDFIFGAGTSVFSTCSVFMKSTTGGTITAAATPASTAYGFLFYKSAITGGAAGVTTLGRPWGANAQVLYLQSTLSNTIATAQPWINMSSNVWQNARFDEYLNTGAGAGVNANRPQLTAAQAASYTPAKYLAGSDAWNPL